MICVFEFHWRSLDDAILRLVKSCEKYRSDWRSLGPIWLRYCIEHFGCKFPVTTILLRVEYINRPNENKRKKYHVRLLSQNYKHLHYNTSEASLCIESKDISFYLPCSHNSCPLLSIICCPVCCERWMKLRK